MLRKESHVDVVVIGGGMAGVSAAVAAARLGSRVALITNRPVLGGNSSSEIRVWVVGATAHGRQKFARETGIMGELFLENQFRNPEGNPYYWDQVVLDLVRSEPRIDLYLNTDVRIVETDDTKKLVSSVTGWTMGSELETKFRAPIFVDCTGDGLVGHLAGADYRVGREASFEYGESLAPESADQMLLGSSMFFYTKDAGIPVPFVPPLIAKDISNTPIPENRIIRTGDNGCDYWWIEWGGHLDTVHDNEVIRDELWSVVFGIWDYIKNSGHFSAQNLTLEWAGSLPGKREYRRFQGDYTLTEPDILNQKSFDDAVAFGGWSIDLHPVEGVYAASPGAMQIYSNGIYEIPFRSLYSRNIKNLLFAGRNISASHVAFGSTRVMATCAAVGQAAGTAAHLCETRKITPSHLAKSHLQLLLTTLHREDAPTINKNVNDDADLVRAASVIASSELKLIDTLNQEGEETLFRVSSDLGLVIPVNPCLDSISFEGSVDSDTSVRIELWETGKPQNFIPSKFITFQVVFVKKGERVQFGANFDWHPEAPCNAFVIVRKNPEVSLRLLDGHPYGLMCLIKKSEEDPVFDQKIPDLENQPLTDWSARELRRRCFAVKVTPSSQAYLARNIQDGIQRPLGGPHLWSSKLIPSPDELEANPEYLELSWEEPQTISSVRIIFNDDVDLDLINLHHHKTPFRTIPELVEKYQLELLVADETGENWLEVASEENNRHRHKVHDFPAKFASKLRLRVQRTCGSPYVQIVAVKAFSKESGRNRLA